MRNSVPTTYYYSQAMGLLDSSEVTAHSLTLIQEGKLKAVLDGPYPFTTQGVRQAFCTLESHYANKENNKVVVKITNLPEKDSQ
jgi:hypothetical protein